MKEKEKIRTVILGVLCYLAFAKTIDLLSIVSAWIEVKFEIYFIAYRIFAYLLIGLVSIGLLLLLYNGYMKNRDFKVRFFYQLIAIIAILTIGVIGIEKGYCDYVESIFPQRSVMPNLEFRKNFLKTFLSLIGLIIFMGKTNSEKNTVANKE